MDAENDTLTGRDLTVIEDAEVVVLAVCDSLRWDARDQLPTLRRLAEDGARVRNCYTPGSSTATTMPALMQSRLPIEHRGYGLRLPPSIPTLAEVLDEAGIETLGLHSNTYTSRQYDFDRGFDTFVDLFERDDVAPGRLLSDGGPDTDAGAGAPSVKDRLRTLVQALNVEGVASEVYDELERWGVVDDPPYTPAATLVDVTAAWLDRVDGRRFAWLQLMDTHSPFEPPAGSREAVDGADVSARRTHDLNERFTSDPASLDAAEFETLRALYEAEARYVDTQLGRLVETLQAADLWESTALIVTADHGELFGDRPVPGRDYSANHPQYLCEELTHVPLWIVGGAVPSVTVDRIASGTDVAPTVADGFGASIPDDWRGVVLDGQAFRDRDHVVSASAHTKGEGMEIDDDSLHVAVRDDSHAVLWWRSDVHTQVFRREADTERYLGDVDAVPEPDRDDVRRLLEVARAYDEGSYDADAGHGSQDDVTDRLRRLGYVE